MVILVATNLYTMEKLTPEQYYAKARAMLQEVILEFWINHAVDREQGGFYGRITVDNTPVPQAAKGAVLNTRILWTFSSAFRVLGMPVYRAMADRAFDYLIRHFWDARHGGVHWMLDHMGQPTDDTKYVYAQSFAIYSLAEYYLATQNHLALAHATHLFSLLEKYAHDRQFGGYFDWFTVNWVKKEGSMGGKGAMDVKSMNTHLHVMECFTNLYRAWPDTLLKERLGDMLQIFMDHIIRPTTWHMAVYSNQKWERTSQIDSYGHDIEASWLLVEAAEAYGDPAILARARQIALEMAKKTMQVAHDPADWGMYYEKEGNQLHSGKEWWPQAEAMVGYLNAFQLANNTQFYEASVRSFGFVSQYLSAGKGGEWYRSYDAATQKISSGDKGNAWKGPYHNGRACLEIIHRLKP
jgi:mannobiose 2-epimerase